MRFSGTGKVVLELKGRNDLEHLPHPGSQRISRVGDSEPHVRLRSCTTLSQKV
jgi:hypothetical protein